jgi:hypothetical protein
MIPGRVGEARPTTKKEVAATLILSLSLAEASVKVSVNEVDDPPEDMDLGFWSGTIPLTSIAGEAIPVDPESESLPVPESIQRFISRRSK